VIQCQLGFREDAPGRMRAEVDPNDDRVCAAGAGARQFVGASDDPYRPVAAREMSGSSKVKLDRSSSRGRAVDHRPDDDAV